MKLKYYLRGIGIGVIITTIIFMVSITIHKEETEPQKVAKQNTESKTVAEYEKSTLQEVTEQNAEPEVLKSTEKGVETNKTDKSEKNATSEKTVNNQEKANTEKSEETVKTDTTEKVVGVEKTAEPEKSADTSQNKGKKKKNKKVRFEVGSGEFSDVISEKLQKAGLVDNAQNFNQFLIENNYDNFIHPGVYNIPKDSTYQEIAIYLTEKPEN